MPAENRRMNMNVRFGMFLCLLIIAGVFIAGCLLRKCNIRECKHDHPRTGLIRIRQQCCSRTLGCPGNKYR